jgi:ribosome-associated toxin RatA of RatAB toxin-antitoxin module
MKKLQANATKPSVATPEQAYALLADPDSYPRWYPAGVPRARTVEHDDQGRPRVAQARLEVNIGPIKRGFDVNFAVTLAPLTMVELRRIPHSPSDREELTVRWRIAPGPDGGTLLTAELDANLSVSPFLPVEPFAPMIAQGFVDAAAAALG